MEEDWEELEEEYYRRERKHFKDEDMRVSGKSTFLLEEIINKEKKKKREKD